MNEVYALVVLSGFFMLLPIISGMFVLRNAPQYIKVFFGFICFSFVFDVVSSSMALNGYHNLWLLKIYMLLDFCFFSWYLNWVFKQAMWPKWVIVLLLVGAGVVLYLSIQSHSVYNYFVLYVLILTIIQSFWAIGYSAFLNSDIVVYRFCVWVLMGRLLSSVILVFAFGLEFDFFYHNGLHYLANFNGLLNAVANITLNCMYTFALLWRFQVRKSL
jgi:hypothetical protein